MNHQEMLVDPFRLVDKKTRKQLTCRIDLIGLTYLGGHISAVSCTGFAVYLMMGTSSR
jgi:hypothetical protein